MFLRSIFTKSLFFNTLAFYKFDDFPHSKTFMFFVVYSSNKIIFFLQLPVHANILNCCLGQNISPYKGEFFAFIIEFPPFKLHYTNSDYRRSKSSHLRITSDSWGESLKLMIKLIK